MDTFINNLLNVMTPQLVLYIVAALLAIIILTVVLKGMKKRSLKSGLVDLETRYNEIKGIPLAFKSIRQLRFPASMRRCSHGSMSVSRALIRYRSH